MKREREMSRENRERVAPPPPSSPPLRKEQSDDPVSKSPSAHGSLWPLVASQGKRIDIEAAGGDSSRVPVSSTGDGRSLTVFDTPKPWPHGSHFGSSPSHKGSCDVPSTLALASASASRGDIFTFGVNQAEGIQSYWDTSDIFLAWDRMRCVVSEDDMRRFSTLTDQEIDELIAGDMARALTLSSIVRDRRLARQAEVGRLEATLKQREDELSQLKREKDKARESVNTWRQRFEREKSTGRYFLASKAGAAFISKTKEEAVSEFQASVELDNMLMDMAIPIYDETIRWCRRILRETGRVSEKDIGLLDPEVDEEEEAPPTCVGDGDPQPQDVGGV